MTSKKINTNSFKKYFPLFLLILCVLNISGPLAQTGKKIAAFGSSVCNGTGDESNAGGYVGHLKLLMKKYDWEVVNVSRGGDNTVKIQERWQKGENVSSRKVEENQFLIPQKPNYVLIGLSLANEGIRKKTKGGQDSVFQQFKSGMLGIMERCRKEGYKIVIANCYPHSAYTPEQYDAIKKMNLLINSWNVPSINLLGTIDDGYGHWIEEMYIDEGHPSSGGHKEMYFSIVPSLFDALAQDKTQPKFVSSTKYALVEYSTEPAIAFIPKETIHSFAISFKIRNPKNVTALKIGGKFASLLKSNYLYKDEKRINSTVITLPDTMNVILKFESGKLVYTSSSGNYFTKEIKLNPAKWYQITYSHVPSKGETKIYFDDELIFKTDEKVIPQRFKIGLRGSCDLKDVLLYRSSLNIEEVRANYEGNLYQSSLENYSPLNDEQYFLNGAVNNLAQSLSNFVVKGKIFSKN